MRQLFSLQTGENHQDSPRNEVRELAHPHPTQVQFRNTAGYTAGTPEHASLVEMLLCVFPEIGEMNSSSQRLD